MHKSIRLSLISLFLFFIAYPANVAAQDEIFVVVEEMPSFPGGDEALQLFLMNNIRYPNMARESGIQGTVYVNFVIEPDGSVTNARVIRDIGAGCGPEALRVVKMMPKWEPGKQKGKAVRTQMSLPVKFVLKEEPKKTEKNSKKKGSQKP